MDTKVCGCCKAELGLEKFGKDKYRADGLNWKCKICNTTSAKKTYSSRILNEAYKEVSRKNCWSCKKELPVASFNKDKTTSDGYKNMCRDCCLVRVREWERNNPQKAKLNNSKARAKRRQNASSPLSDYFAEDIWTYYFVAKSFTTKFGEKFHVDHIVPLCGIGVCGLHVPWNMRVLSRFQNQTKNNKLIGELIDLSAPAYKGLNNEQKKNLTS